MRGKRSKQYRKLMNQYGLSFGFREPYQVLLDAGIIRDADRFKMDLVGGLERTFHGQVKPMITQCSMRHLYAAAAEPGVSYLIDRAKMFERRRCGHLPSDYPEPLSTQECLRSVVDPKGTKHNKHRYCVASQDLDTRKAMREVLGVPLVYISRSVMVMEPMATATAYNREREERGKFRDGLKKHAGGLKRKRDGEHEIEKGDTADGDTEMPKKKKKVRGPKQPNPLSVKKSKKQKSEGENEESALKNEPEGSNPTQTEGSELGAKKKRRRKHKKANVEQGGKVDAAGAGAGDSE